MRGLVKLFILLSAALALSCHRRPLFDPEDSALLKVRLVTDGIHNVTCDIYNPNVEVPPITSDMMRVFIYEPDGAPILSQGFISTKRIDENGYEVLSGPLSLTMGRYKLLSYNFDLDVTQISDESSYNTIQATTQAVPQYFYSRFNTRADEFGTVLYPPEHLMVARASELNMHSHHGIKNIELDAHTIVDTYYIQIKITGAGNMAKNAKCQALLTGVAPSNCFGPNIRNSEPPASLYFEMQRNIDPNTRDGENNEVLCAVFNTFGKIQDVESDLHVTLSVLTRDGKTHQKVIDMEPIFETEDARERHWLLIEEEWDIPDIVIPEGNGGFAPDVDDWKDIEETIPIGPRN